MKFQLVAFRDATPQRGDMTGYQRFGGPWYLILQVENLVSFYPQQEDGDSRVLLWNLGILSYDYMASHPRRTRLEYCVLCSVCCLI